MVLCATSASLSRVKSSIASSITSRREPAGVTMSGAAPALGDRHVDVLQHGEAAEQPVDLEGAGDAELDPFGLLDLGDVAALEQHLAGARRQQAGEQIDEGGL